MHSKEREKEIIKLLLSFISIFLSLFVSIYFMVKISECITKFNYDILYSMNSSVNNLLAIKLIKMYLITLFCIYALLCVYDIELQILNKLISYILSFGCYTKKLHVTLICNELEYFVKDIFYKMSISYTRNFNIEGIYHLYYVLKSVITGIFKIKVQNIVSICIVFTYIRYEWFLYVIDTIFKNLSNNNLDDIIMFIDKFEINKIKNYITTGFVILIALYFINYFIYRKYSQYVKFEFALKELEKEKIKKVVEYQERISDLLIIIGEKLFWNINEFSKLIIDFKDGYYNFLVNKIKQKDNKIYLNDEYMPFKYGLKDFEDFSKELEEIIDIIKKMEDERVMEVYKNYNNQFIFEVFSMGILSSTDKRLCNLKYLDRKYIKDTLDKRIEKFNKYFDEEHLNNEVKEAEFIFIENWVYAIKYYIYIKNYVEKFQKRKNKIMRYCDINSKLGLIDNKIGSKIKF